MILAKHNIWFLTTCYTVALSQSFMEHSQKANEAHNKYDEKTTQTTPQPPINWGFRVVLTAWISDPAGSTTTPKILSVFWSVLLIIEVPFLDNKQEQSQASKVAPCASDFVNISITSKVVSESQRWPLAISHRKVFDLS